MTEAELIELKKLARSNTYHAHGDPQTADCVIAFSFGYVQQGEKVLPGKSNQQLASFIEERFSTIPVIAQFEIGTALQKISATYAITTHYIPGKYLDSGEVARQAHEYMVAHSWQRAIIVTHPALEARNDYACSSIGIVTIAPLGLETIEYDIFSAQSWTRNAKDWWTREEGVIDLCYKNDWLRLPSDLAH